MPHEQDWHERLSRNVAMEPISSHRGDVHAREASAGAEGSAEDDILSRDENSAVAQEAVAQEAGFGDDIGAHGALSPEAEASFSLFARDDTDESDEATLIKTRKCGDEEKRRRERHNKSLKRHTSFFFCLTSSLTPQVSHSHVPHLSQHILSPLCITARCPPIRTTTTTSKGSLRRTHRRQLRWPPRCRQRLQRVMS